MGTTFGIPMTEPTKKHEGYENYMKRRLRETEQQSDMVNNPTHYTHGAIECIDAIEAALGPEGFIAFLRGNIIKYNWRCKHKAGLEDIEKARWYVNKLIDTMRTKAEHQNPPEKEHR